MLNSHALPISSESHHCGSVLLASRPGAPPLHGLRSIGQALNPINDYNAAILDSVTEPIPEYANPVTTLPPDLLLWHCQLTHHNLTDVKALIEHNLISGMQLDVKTAPDLICEPPCLAGKDACSTVLILFCSSKKMSKCVM